MRARKNPAHPSDHQSLKKYSAEPRNGARGEAVRPNHVRRVISEMQIFRSASGTLSSVITSSICFLTDSGDSQGPTIMRFRRAGMSALKLISGILMSGIE